MWFTYIILTKNNKLYTGITNNLLRRYQQHEQGTGSKFLRSNPPKKYIFIFKQETRSDASKLEANIKKLTRTQKNKLIKQHKIQTNKFVLQKKLN